MVDKLRLGQGTEVKFVYEALILMTTFFIC